MLVFGESILNDAVSIVLTTTIVESGDSDVEDSSMVHQVSAGIGRCGRHRDAQFFLAGVECPLFWYGALLTQYSMCLQVFHDVLWLCWDWNSGGDVEFTCPEIHWSLHKSKVTWQHHLWPIILNRLHVYFSKAHPWDRRYSAKIKTSNLCNTWAFWIWIFFTALSLVLCCASPMYLTPWQRCLLALKINHALLMWCSGLALERNNGNSLLRHCYVPLHTLQSLPSHSG